MSSDAMAATPPPASNYPLRFDVQYPESSSRLLLFFRWLLAIPHFIILYLLILVLEVVTFIAFLSILFTKKYPKGLFDFAVNVLRWEANVGAYLGMLRDDYPPFSMEAGKYPVTFEVDYQTEMSRWAPLYKWLLIIPNLIVLVLVYIVMEIVWILAWFVILFTGKFPKGMYDFIVGGTRWSYRVSAYLALLTDKYPPFSMK
jgi:hypothetical protein